MAAALAHENDLAASGQWRAEKGLRHGQGLVGPVEQDRAGLLEGGAHHLGNGGEGRGV